MTFERVVETVALITHNRIVLRELKQGKVKENLFNRKHVEQLFSSACRVTSFIRRVIEEMYGNEIPEVKTVPSHSQNL